MGVGPKPMTWTRTSLGGVCTIIMGQSPPGSTYNDTGHGLPFFQGVKDFGTRYPCDRMYCTAPSRIADKEDILFSVRAPIGKINRANRTCAIGRGLCMIHADAKSDTDFIEYLLRSMHRSWSVFDGQGAIFGNVRRNDLEKLEIRWPPIHTRTRITSVLSGYDDLIETNWRRIQLLEQSARLLYKEWFVHLCFPGYEHTTITNGVPDGWEKKALSEIATITMGQSPKSIHYNEDGIGLPFHQGVTHFGSRFPSHRTYCTVQNRLAESGDILFSVRAPVGRINIAPEKIVIGRGIAAIRSDRDQQNFLFYALKNRFFEEDMIGGGTIFASVSKKDMHRIELTQPSDDIARMFVRHVSLIDRQISNLQRTINGLHCARDTILPRLMNGEVAACR